MTRKLRDVPQVAGAGNQRVSWQPTGHLYTHVDQSHKGTADRGRSKCATSAERPLAATPEVPSGPDRCVEPWIGKEMIMAGGSMNVTTDHGRRRQQKKFAVPCGSGLADVVGDCCTAGERRDNAS